jgi:hypothetical protein
MKTWRDPFPVDVPDNLRERVGELAVATTTSHTCSTSNKMGHGDHEFEQGAATYTYQTQDSNC